MLPTRSLNLQAKHVFWSKTMKFTGLILICATSCLALLLPAIGVVDFPDMSYAGRTVAAPAGPPAAAQFLVNQSTGSQNQLLAAQNGNGWVPATFQQDLLQGGNFGGGSTLPPSPFPAVEMSPTQTKPQEIATNSPSTNKIRMGLWLLLGPVCLIGLAMWTFARNPGVSKPKK